MSIFKPLMNLPPLSMLHANREHSALNEVNEIVTALAWIIQLQFPMQMLESKIRIYHPYINHSSKTAEEIFNLTSLWTMQT